MTRMVCRLSWPWRAVFCTLLLVGSARADVTLRQSVGVKFAPFVPAAVEQQARKQADSVTPMEMVLRIKGDKAYASFGKLLTVTDYGRNEVTLLNPGAKHFATVPLS